MAPTNPPAVGNLAGGPPAPPICPHTFNALLARDPATAAAILVSMRPAAFHAQVEAHAELTSASRDRVAWEWRSLIAAARPRRYRMQSVLPSGVPVPRLSGAVYDTEMLADLLAVHPKQADELLGQLTHAQRVTQAVAYAAWLAEHDIPVTLDEVLEGWGEVRDAAA